jgi:hypothetical protein
LIKIVTRLPLVELSNNSGQVIAEIRGDLVATDIVNLLRFGPVQFVIANVGDPLRWIPLTDCFCFWKSEVRPHLANSSNVTLDEFPDEYCYFAQEWSTDSGPPIVVLSMSH